MRNQISKIIVFLSLVLLITSLGPSLADREGKKVITISSPEDLYQLAEDASLDKWSIGKKVVLAKDIDLANENFPMIPIFSGEFDGAGYSIRGLYIDAEGSNIGLFRYLEKEGSIKNLHVEGSISSKGDRQNIGGIVANNKGTIENVSFKGFVRGKDSVGGIAGINTNEGKLINIDYDGLVQGETKIGGIVGFNTGTIINAKNRSNVNTSLQESKLGYENFLLDDINIASLSADSMDIGGLVGLNTGVISASINEGRVGYQSKGYNVGGIAGRQSGYMIDNKNYGKILGRKDIGGIVGQMEPYIDAIIPSSKLEKLRSEIDDLDRHMGRLTAAIKDSSNSLTSNFTDIGEGINDSRKHIESLINQTEDMLNKDIEKINKISLIAVEAMGQIDSIFEATIDSLENMSRAVEPLRKSLGHISEAMKELGEFSDEYKILSELIDQSEKDMEEIKANLDGAREDFEKIISILKEMIKESDLRNDLESFLKGQIGLDELIDRLEPSAENRERIRQILMDYGEGRIDSQEAIRLLIKLKNEEILGLLDSAFKKIEESSLRLGEMLKDLEGMKDSLSNIVDSLGSLGKEMKEGLDDLVKVIDIIRESKEDIGKVIGGISKLSKYLSSQEAPHFQTTDEKYQLSKEGLFTSMDRLSRSFSKFNKNLNKKTNILVNSLEDVNDMFFRVMNTLLDIVEDLSNFDLDPSKRYEDISDKDIESSREGKLANSYNYGEVKGDINVGGLAGAMSIEIKFDPEEDLGIDKRIHYDTVYQTRAIIVDGYNEANVSSKKDGAGGIVGNQDLGYIRNTSSQGSIKSSNGNYVGGIAGLSKGPIVQSYSKTELSGGNYIGGIVGYGRDIRKSYSLVSITESKAYIGAIAGNLEQDNKLEANYFVSDGLRGVDGISYGDKAESISYEELISKEDLPKIFKEFELELWADDKLIDKLDFNYGDSIRPDELAKIPEKDGHYAKWEEISLDKLLFDKKLYAQYIPYISSLESKEKRDERLAILLVEGRFKEGDQIVLNKLPSEKINSRESIEIWEVSIARDGQDSHIIRYLPPENNKRIDIYQDNGKGWKKVKTRLDGKYLVFETKGDVVKFSALDRKTNYLNYIAYGLLLISALVIVFIYLKVRRKRQLAK